MDKNIKDIYNAIIFVVTFFLLVNCAVYYQAWVYEFKTKNFIECYKAVSELPGDIEEPDASFTCVNAREDKHEDLGT